jgi:hypothetical protein
VSGVWKLTDEGSVFESVGEGEEGGVLEDVEDGEWWVEGMEEGQGGEGGWRVLGMGGSEDRWWW